MKNYKLRRGMSKSSKNLILDSINMNPYDKNKSSKNNKKESNQNLSVAS